MVKKYSTMFGNEFAVGNKPNNNSFKKGNIPWNAGIGWIIRKCINPNCNKNFKIRRSWKNKFCSHQCFSLINVPWNKGLTKENDKRVDRISKKLTGISLTEDHKKNLRLNHKGMSGKKRSLKDKRNLSKIRKKLIAEGKIILKGGFKKGHIGYKYFLGKKLTKEHICKILRRREKSSLEIKFEQIIQKYNLPYKFVGNGEVLIGRKCPDFVNVNGQKIAVEVFYRKHKELFREGLGNWMQERWKLFNSYGWELRFFDETQVNEKEVLRRIG